MASYFWVGGSGNWDGTTTTHWASSSGGTGGAGQPGTSDTVTFDANSGSATITLTSSTITISTLVSSSALNTLSLGSNTLTLNGTSTPWNWTAGTLSAGTSTLSFTGNGTYNMSTKTYYNCTWNGSTGGYTINGAASYNNFTVTPGLPSGGQTNLILSNNFTVTGTLTLTGYTDGTHNGLMNVAPGIPSRSSLAITITAAAVSLSHLNLFDITGAGAATWSGTQIGNGGGLSNITTTTPATYYWVGNGGNFNLLAHYSTSSGGATGANMPLASDTLIFDSNSFSSTSQSISVNNGGSNTGVLPTMNFANVTNNPQLSMGAGNVLFNGNLTLGTMTTNSNSTSIYMTGRGSQTITSNGATIQMNVNIHANGGTYTLQDNMSLSSSRSLQVWSGTFNANGKNISAGSSGVDGNSQGYTRAVNMGSGTWTLTGTGTVWAADYTTNLSFTPSTATVIVSDTSSSTKTLNLGSLTPSLTNISLPASTGTITLQAAGNITIGSLNLTAGGSYVFTHGHTYTLSTNPSWLGASGNLITITSDSAGNQATISVSSGKVVCNYLSLKDNAATGGANFYGGANSTFVSNVTGWLLSNPPSGNFLMFM